MNTNTRVTLKSTNARIDALEAGLGRIEALLLAQNSPSEPAKRVTRKPATRKATKPKASAKATKALTRGNREQFVKAAPWAKGLSTQVIALMCLEDAALLPSGWVIGERRTAMLSA